MNVESLASSTIGKVIIKVMGSALESPIRYRFFSPTSILKGADIQPGETVLEVGCGTSFFTLSAGELIGDQGKLVAMDMLSESVELVSGKVQNTNLTNVRVIKGDAMDTKMETGSFDAVLLFGVIPSPALPLYRLLPEMHRLLKAGGTLAVWPSIPVLLPRSISGSGLFTYASRKNGVCNFRRS